MYIFLFPQILQPFPPSKKYNKEILDYLATKYGLKNDTEEEWEEKHRMITTNKYYEEYCNAEAYIAIVQEYIKMYVMDGYNTNKRRTKKKVKEIMMNLELNWWKKGLYDIYIENDDENDSEFDRESDEE